MHFQHRKQTLIQKYTEIRQHNHQLAKKKMIDSFLNRKPTHIKMDKLLLKDPEEDAVTDPNIIKNMAVNHYKQIVAPTPQKQKMEESKWRTEYAPKPQINPA
ncbi:6468_t:CDS:1, partial [Acaulospora morrowiae]